MVFVTLSKGRRATSEGPRPYWTPTEESGCVRPAPPPRPTIAPATGRDATLRGQPGERRAERGFTWILDSGSRVSAARRSRRWMSGYMVRRKTSSSSCSCSALNDVRLRRCDADGADAPAGGAGGAGQPLRKPAKGPGPGGGGGAAAGPGGRAGSAGSAGAAPKPSCWDRDAAIAGRAYAPSEGRGPRVIGRGPGEGRRRAQRDGRAEARVPPGGRPTPSPARRRGNCRFRRRRQEERRRELGPPPTPPPPATPARPARRPQSTSRGGRPACRRARPGQRPLPASSEAVYLRPLLPPPRPLPPAPSGYVPDPVPGWSNSPAPALHEPPRRILNREGDAD